MKKYIISSVTALFIYSNAFADDISYSLEKQSLKNAIEAISKKANKQYLVDSSLLNGKISNEIRSIKGTKNALREVLKDSGLIFTIEDNVIIIKSRKSINGGTLLDEVAVRERINFNSSGYTNQLKQETSTGSKLGLTIKETPASVEMINSKTMKQRGDTTVTSAVTKATGITGGISGHGPGGRFAARGFTGVPGVSFLNDGIKVKGSAFSNRAFEVANLDSIEIIRGASSVLNGEGSIGATVNLITKKPSFAKEETELGFKAGSYDSYGFEFGTGGIAIEDKLAYRVDVSSREIGSNFDGEKREVDSLSTGLLYKINDTLIASISIEKSKDDTENAYTGTPLVNGKLDKNIRKLNYNISTDNIEKGENLYIKQNIEWYPTSNFELKNQAYYQDGNAYIRQAWRTLQIGNTDQVGVESTEIAQKEDLIGNRLDLIYKSNFFGFENKLLVGTDISKLNYSRDKSVWDGAKHTTNIFNPDRDNFTNVGGKYKEKYLEASLLYLSLYMEDQLSIIDNLKFVTGLRHDTIKADWDYSKYHQGGIDIHKDKNYGGLSYRAGIVYDIADTTTLYATYSKAVEAGYALLVLSPAQTNLDLTEASQYEIGLKQSFFDNKAELSFSAYNIKKENMIVNNPNVPNGVIGEGKQTSKGYEIAFGIQPIQQLQIDANLSYTDTKFVNFIDGGYDYSGKTPNSIPKYLANLGIRYMPISNLGIGTWVSYVDSFYVDNKNSVEIPSHTVINLNLDYTYNKNTTFQFLLKNLTDELYNKWERQRRGIFR